MKVAFLSALAKDGAINEPALSFENLGKAYGSLQKQVSESLEKQGPLIDRIRVIMKFKKIVSFFVKVFI